MRIRQEAEGIRVLVVDDTAVIREQLREMLEDFAYVVQTAEDGRHALEVYPGFEPDIILLDMNMPRMGGLEVIQRIRGVEDDADVLIIMLTSDHDPQRKIEAFGAGANDFLYKPFDRAELLARVGVGARQVRLTARLKSTVAAVDRELALVASLQEKLLPEQELLPVSWPEMPGLRVESMYLPSGRASGDYFDYFPMSKGVLRVIVADVSGHGARAAFIMSIVRTLFRVSHERAMGLAETFSLISRQLMDIIGKEDDFVSVFAADLDFEARTITYLNAGHCPGILVTADGVEDLGPSGTVLGFFEIGFEERQIALPDSGGLFLFTDGFYDWKRRNGDLFSFDDFHAMVVEVAKQGGERFPGRILESLGRAGAPPQFRDDVTALWLALGVRQKKAFSCEATPGVARQTVREIVAELGRCIHDRQTLYDFDLAIMELVANAVEHAYIGDTPGVIDISIEVVPLQSVSVQVSDCGPGFDCEVKSLAAPEADAVSGRGLFIVSQLVDEVNISHSGQKNVVSFLKKVKKKAWKACG